MDTRFSQEFDGRLAGRLDELKWLYMELYHGDAQACDYFVGMLLCLDFVMNHTSEDHEWAKRARTAAICTAGT